MCRNEDFDKRIVLHNIFKKYENHFSITKIRCNMSPKIHFNSNSTLPSTRQATSNEVNLILKSLNTKTAPGTDKIPTKLIKLASNFLSIAINNSVALSKFPEIAKIATVVPIEVDEKYNISLDLYNTI